jgi:2-methylcitrate dehydratase PrpD
VKRDRKRLDAGVAIEFIHELHWGDIPAEVQRRVAWLFVDFAAVSIAGRTVPAARIAADYASSAHAGNEATALVDGRRLSLVGAALANGVLANALDWDDGHRLTKGHPGAVVIPAALAAAELIRASPEELTTAIVVGYEVAIRAGISQHANSTEYSASGSWGSLGAAAAVSRLLQLDNETTRRALSLAEYHSPIAPMMRSVSAPAMTKDATGWGALIGTSSALLADAGFTATEARVLSDRCWFDLGGRWEAMNVYVKPYPCCRWSQPAIAAAAHLRRTSHFAPSDVSGMTIATFAAAAAQMRRRPTTTEEAQYNLIWPTANALLRGDFGVDDATGNFQDRAVCAIHARTRVTVDAEMTAEFPARRVASVEVDLRDGRSLHSGPTEAPGEPEDPKWEAVVVSKANRFLESLRGPRLDECAALTAADCEPSSVAELVDALGVSLA